MPEPVRQTVHPALIVTCAQPRRIGPVVVRDIAEFQLLKSALLRLGHLTGESDLQFTKIGGESDLLLVGERLIREGQYGVLVHATLDRSHLVAGKRPANIDAGDFADKAVLNRPYIDRHSLNLRTSG